MTILKHLSSNKKKKLKETLNILLWNVPQITSLATFDRPIVSQHRIDMSL